MALNYLYHDGGRAGAGFVGGVADCVTRAIAIETGLPYAQIHAEVLALAPDADRMGVDIFSPAFEEYMRGTHARVFVPLRYPVRVGDFPDIRSYMVLTKNHVTAINYGGVRDVFDCRNELARGYWVLSEGRFNVWDANGVKLNGGSLSLAQAVKMRDMMYLNYKKITWLI